MVYKISTGKVRLSYAQVWEPKEQQNGLIQYSCALLIKKSDKKTIAKINSTLKAMLADKDVINKLDGKIKGANMPLLDGDVNKPEDPVYADCYYINAKAYEGNPPKILDRNKNEIMDKDEVYSGCYCQAVIQFKPYNNNSRGIRTELLALRKLADGDKLSGTVVSDDDFDDDIDESVFGDDTDDGLEDIPF